MTWVWLVAALAFPAHAEKAALDVHCHLACLPTAKNDCFVSPRLLDSWKYKVYLRFLHTTRKELEATDSKVVADYISAQITASSEVAKAVVLALDGVYKDGVLDKAETEVYVPNEFVLAEVRRHSNLLFGASINPHRKDALEKLAWAKKNGAVLVKWIPSVMGIDPADPALEPFYRKLIEYKLPLLVHTGDERTFTRSHDELCDPVRLSYPLSLGVTVIAAHLASTGKVGKEKSFDRLLPLFKKYPTLYGDISATTQFNRIGFLRKALKAPELKGRLVYGTDWPLQSFPIVSRWYHLGTISSRQARAVGKIENQWDRDVALKRAMGVPDEVLSKGWELVAPK